MIGSFKIFPIKVWLRQLAYPSINIEFVVLENVFGPRLIKELSQEWNIPINFMFIGSPGNHFMHGMSELGGVRLII
jgi:hypothetical protein